MGLIEDIKNRIRNYENQIESDRANIGTYETKIDDIDRIYRAMQTEKDHLDDLKQALKTITNDNPPNWKGNIYDEQYQPKLEDQLINGSLKTTISNVDDNLDALNRAKTDYENKINRTQGAIGTLEGLINSAWTSVENLMN